MSDNSDPEEDRWFKSGDPEFVETALRVKIKRAIDETLTVIATEFPPQVCVNIVESVVKVIADDLPDECTGFRQIADGVKNRCRAIRKEHNLPG